MLSRSDERLILALQRRKARTTRGLFLAEGLRVVEELARSSIDLKFALVSTTLDDSARGHALHGALQARTRVLEVGERMLRELAATEQPQGVLAVAHEPTVTLPHIPLAAQARVLVCDAVQDPGNLGTLIRSAHAFAAAAVVLLPGTVDAWNPKVVRAAAGSSFHVPIVAAGAAELSDWLRRHSFQTWGAAPHGEPFTREHLPARVALVVGNEGAGLSAPTQPLIDRSVRIAMPGRTESLNVGVAAGILLYLLSEHRP